MYISNVTAIFFFILTIPLTDTPTQTTPSPPQPYRVRFWDVKGSVLRVTFLHFSVSFLHNFVRSFLDPILFVFFFFSRPQPPPPPPFPHCPEPRLAPTMVWVSVGWVVVVLLYQLYSQPLTPTPPPPPPPPTTPLSYYLYKVITEDRRFNKSPSSDATHRRESSITVKNEARIICIQFFVS